MAKVCTNISGLAKALVRDGSIDSVEAFRDFTIGFTQGKVSFEYVDVGHGKERADSKIKGTTYALGNPGLTWKLWKWLT